MENKDLRRVRVIDSHTGGEPTRTVISGGPELGSGSMAERLERFRSEHDNFRSAVVNEPRGSDVLVGALLCSPVDEWSATGVMFFNNVGYLGMCGHGTIGVTATLAHLNLIHPGVHTIETPVGKVTAELHESGEVTLTSVPSYRFATHVAVDVPGYGRLYGDVAWGGNWFFLVSGHQEELSLARIEELTNFTWNIREALQRQRITGEDGQEIDHIELFGPSGDGKADSKNFVLCPGKAYDRSPCGTGTSAKLACLHADGKLKPGQIWRQESILGSIFEGSFSVVDGKLYPHIKGTSYVNAEADLLLNDRDPFCMGIRR